MERVKGPMSLVNAANPAAVELHNHVSPPTSASGISTVKRERHYRRGLGARPR